MNKSNVKKIIIIAIMLCNVYNIVYSQSYNINYFSEAQKYYYSGDYQDAIDYYLKAYQQDESLKNKCFIEIAKSYEKLAFEEEKAKNVENAKEYYNKAILYDNNNSIYYLKYAIFLEKIENYKESKEQFKKAIEHGGNKKYIDEKIKKLNKKIQSYKVSSQSKTDSLPTMPKISGTLGKNKAIIQKAQYAVVNIYSEPDGKIDLFQKLSKKQPRNGSGVIITSSGFILTCYHVISHSTNIFVTLHNQSEYKAKIVGVDKDIDIALIKIDASKLVPLPFGDSDKVQVGDQVLIVGSPEPSKHSFIPGIISTVHKMDLHLNPIEDYFQTDIAISKSNSGGPMLNEKGEILGINGRKDFIYGEKNIGFTIPVKLFKDSINYLIKGENISRNWLGVFLQIMNREFQEKYKISRGRGLWVEEVVLNSPAYKAGIRRGHILKKIDGLEINSYHDVFKVLHSKKKNDPISFNVNNNGKLKKLIVNIGSRESKLTLTPYQVFRLYFGIDISVNENAEDLEVRIKRIPWRFDKYIEMAINDRIRALAPSSSYGIKEELLEKKQFEWLINDSYFHDGLLIGFEITIKNCENCPEYRHRLVTIAYKNYY